MELKITVYGRNREVKKECKGETVDIMFGTIRKLAKLFKMDEFENSSQILATVSSAWDEVTHILDECFPDMEPEDWDGVKLKDLLPVLVEILKDAFVEMAKIPHDEKNA